MRMLSALTLLFCLTLFTLFLDCHASATFCNESYECAGESVTSDSSVFALGYRSIYGSNASISISSSSNSNTSSFTIRIDGAFACESTGSIEPNDNSIVWIGGGNGAMSSQILTTSTTTVSPRGTVTYADGVASLWGATMAPASGAATTPNAPNASEPVLTAPEASFVSSTLSNVANVSNTANESMDSSLYSSAPNVVICGGSNACRGTQFNGTRSLFGAGAFSLAGAVIRSAGTNVSVELSGLYAGYAALVECDSGDFCSITCLGNGCFGMFLKCIGTASCQVSCASSEGTACPTDISHLNEQVEELPTAEISDDVAALGVTGYYLMNATGATEANDEACDGTTHSNDNHRASQLFESIDVDDGFVCCRASGVCEGLDNIKIGSDGLDASGLNSIVCSAANACQGVGELQIDGIESNSDDWDDSGEMGGLFCDGSGSCQGAMIGLGGNGVIACGGRAACKDALLSNASVAVCTGWDQSCGSSEISNVRKVIFAARSAGDFSVVHSGGVGNLSVVFASYRSAKNASVKCEQRDRCKVTCLDNESCQGVRVQACGGNVAVTCDGEGDECPLVTELCPISNETGLAPNATNVQNSLAPSGTNTATEMSSTYAQGSSSTMAEAEITSTTASTTGLPSNSPTSSPTRRLTSRPTLGPTLSPTKSPVTTMPPTEALTSTAVAVETKHKQYAEQGAGVAVLIVFLVCVCCVVWYCIRRRNNEKAGAHRVSADDEIVNDMNGMLDGPTLGGGLGGRRSSIKKVRGWETISKHQLDDNDEMEMVDVNLGDNIDAIDDDRELSAGRERRWSID